MKTPQWLMEKIAIHGNRVLKREATEEEVAVELTTLVLQKQDADPPLAHRVVADYVRRQLKSWLDAHRRVASEDGEDGQLDLFPDIPRKLEVAPGRFVAQAWMTRRDWTNAVKQADTKASNASGHAEAIKRIAEKVLPLLVDDEQTTADVWPAAQHRAIGGA